MRENYPFNEIITQIMKNKIKCNISLFKNKKIKIDKKNKN